MQLLYFIYGNVLLISGVAGYVLTHAKSALISGSISALVMIVLSIFAAKPGFVRIIARVINVILGCVFTWRAFLALSALQAGNPDKLIPTILLAVMMLASVVTFFIGFVLEEQDEAALVEA